MSSEEKYNYYINTHSSNTRTLADLLLFCDHMPDNNMCSNTFPETYEEFSNILCKCKSMDDDQLLKWLIEWNNGNDCVDRNILAEIIGEDEYKLLGDANVVELANFVKNITK